MPALNFPIYSHPPKAFYLFPTDYLVAKQYTSIFPVIQPLTLSFNGIDTQSVY